MFSRVYLILGLTSKINGFSGGFLGLKEGFLGFSKLVLVF